MKKVFGIRQGFSAVHAKGPVVEGTFTGSAQGAFLRKASLFDGSPIPVTVRFSDSGGVPTIPDGAGGSNQGPSYRNPWGSTAGAWQ